MSDDLISRSALKKEFDDKCAYECAICKYAKDFAPCKLIDNAQPVEKPQGDLISREAFREQLNRAYEYTELGEVIEMLDNAPTVDTTCPNCDSGYAQGYSDGYLKGKEERPKGRWVKEEDKVHSKCSLCGFKYADYGILFDYCPNCGADMRGGKE